MPSTEGHALTQATYSTYASGPQGKYFAFDGLYLRWSKACIEPHDLRRGREEAYQDNTVANVSEGRSCNVRGDADWHYLDTVIQPVPLILRQLQHLNSIIAALVRGTQTPERNVKQNQPTNQSVSSVILLRGFSIFVFPEHMQMPPMNIDGTQRAGTNIRENPY